MSILITGNILHESSSAPQQHKSVQYKLFALYLHGDVSHAEGFRGRGQHVRTRNFCQFYLISQLILQFTKGVQWFYS